MSTNKNFFTRNVGTTAMGIRTPIVKGNDKIIISKLKNKHITLKERIKQYKGSNLAKDFIWDENVGKEIW